MSNGTERALRRATALLIALAAVAVADAATITVTNNNDSGAGSLRQAIVDAGSGDEIVFDAGLMGATITLTSGQLSIAKNLTITGPGASYLTISGNNSSRVFITTPGYVVNVSDLTISDGRSSFSDGGGIRNACTMTLSDCVITSCTAPGGGASNNGGGLYNAAGTGVMTLTRCTISNNTAPSGSGGGVYDGGTMTMVDCTISGNSSDAGGGLMGQGTTTLNNCTISGNTSDGSGGGVYTATTVNLNNCTISGNSATGHAGGVNQSGVATTRLFSCTITNNTADSDTNGGGDGGGIYRGAGTMYLQNTLVAGNIDSGGQANDIYGTITSGDYNLVQDTTGATINGTTTHNITGQNPLLSALADNGGYTQTHALGAGSPAVDAADPTGSVDHLGAALATDQRGVARPQRVYDDIGAYEAAPTKPETPTALGPANCVDGSVIANQQPTLTFTQDDPQDDNVAYQIQIDDDSDFSSPTTDYVSALGAEGAASFTVGQAVGAGLYNDAGPGQTLSPGDYYWRVRSNDGSENGAWATANGGAIAFSVIIKASLTTASVSGVTAESAACGGSVFDDGGDAVTARGVCWNTAGSPTVADGKTTDGAGLGGFVSSITGLDCGVTYYVRAYATNNAGTAYGVERSFTTLDLPTVTTTAITDIDEDSAVSGGAVTDNGGDAVIERGVCWNTAGAPTVADDTTCDGVGSGNFTSTLDGLDAGTTYYVRAYATNGVGTAYGAEVHFTTNAASTPDDPGDTPHVPAPDLHVSLSQEGVAAGDTPAPVNVGDETSFVATVTNDGDGDATNVVVTVTIPDNSEFVSAQLLPDQAGQESQSVEPTVTVDGDTVTLSFAAVTAGQTYQVEIVFRAFASGAMTISAAVASDENATPVEVTATVTATDEVIRVVETLTPLMPCGPLGLTPLAAIIGLIALRRRL